MKLIYQNSACIRWAWMTCLFAWLIGLPLSAQQGLPFIMNYPSNVYGAHNRNFDVVCDSAGIVYFANFEGIIYYNGANWGKILTPGISRITRLHIDHQNQLWAGGYNYIGKLSASSIGTPQLISYLSDATSGTVSMRIGEVNSIVERGDSLIFRTPQYQAIMVGDSLLPIQPHLSSTQEGAPVTTLTIANRWTVSKQEGGGLVIEEPQWHRSFSISEVNGLCSDQVNALATDALGSLWGATDQGIFRINFPSFYTRFTSLEGLKGEVTTIQRYLGQLWVGTLHGLFRLNPSQNRFEAIPEIRQACWQLKISASKQCYAATTNGLFLINSHQVVPVSDQNTLSVTFDPVDEQVLYTGELDGIYRIRGRARTKIASVEKAVKLEFIQGKLWAETLYGAIYQVEEQTGETLLLDSLKGLAEVDGNRLYVKDGEAATLSAHGIRRWDTMQHRFTPLETAIDSLVEQGIWWPSLLAKAPEEDSYWIVDGDGKEIKILNNRELDEQGTQLLLPLKDFLVRALYIEGNGIAWLGGEFGLVCFDSQQTDYTFLHQPEIRIRQIQLNKENYYFDGPNSDLTRFNLREPIFPSSTKELSFAFSSSVNDAIYPTKYSFYLEGYENSWRPWTEESEKEYTNLSYGTYTFHVKARDAFGRESEEEIFTFRILIPFYLKWYCLILYLLLFIFLIFIFLRYRTHKLLQEKLRLEAVIAERTQEIVAQRDEIAEKSTKLELTLHELKEAQAQLIRQEKVATVGKLTQGLIDRILNPLNYIINFSHLSNSLLKDMREDVEDEQEQISEDNYEDMQEILDMLNTHLTKIEEHGQSTSRILKAMEELLSDQGLHFKEVEINQFISGNIAMLREYDRKEIEKNQIAIEFTPLPAPLQVEADPVQLGKAIVSILHNGVYALAKKYAHKPFEACLQIKLELQGDQLLIYLRDNGIGIELNIREKIFDPFFTTKTTAEAAGVGLYLCREVILSHKGQIEVQSTKNEFTAFVLTIPIHQSIKTNSDE